MKASSSFSPYKIKGLQLGLWSIWLSGISLIAFSFYVTQLLPFPIKDQITKSKVFLNGFISSETPTITIFTAPPSFSGSVGARQALAVRSWLGLSPDITVVLFSQDPSVVSFAAGFGARVSVESDIDFTFLSTPFFHSMIARSQASKSSISVLIDPETILLPDFISVLNYAHKLDNDWLLIASSRNLSYFPFHLDEDGKHWLDENGKRIRTKKLQGSLAQSWQWKHCEDRMLLAWNNGDLPLHTGVLPPFLFGKGLHNHWIINEALSSRLRFVFDASWSISNFYLSALDNMSYQFRDSSVPNFELRSWEYMGNSHLAALYGSLFFHEENYSNLVKFLKCGRQYVFVNSAESIAYPFGYQRLLSLRKEEVLRSQRRKIVDCVHGIKTLDGTRDCSMKDKLKPSISLSLPFSLEMFLSMLADQNKTIVLAIAGYSYKDMLMSWVCNLRHLLISNFVVCALDHDIYHFSVLQGLPVFKDSLAPSNISFNDCHFGSQCFQRVTKVKSRVVLQILKLGYNVLLSDVDVYWFKNPLPFLYSFGPAVLVAQSDEYNRTGPINLPRRLNSGFYFARSDGPTVAALEKVVKHAATSNGMGMDSSEAKAEVQPKRVTPIWSPSGDAMACSALAVPSEETNARKKLRLNWGEGLAKYEKKKVEASDDRATNPGMIVCGNTDPMHSHLSNLSEKSPRVAGTSDCRSPTIPSPIACSSSPGGEETPFVREVNILGDAINLNSSTGLLSQSHVEGIAFNLESLKLSPIPNLSTSLCEFFQSEELEDSSFVRSTPMNKLLLWKGDILKELEVTESEIELLENEFKCLISKNENRCQCPAGSSSLQQECQTKPCEKLVVNSNAIPQPAPLQLASSEGVAVDDGGGLKKEHGQVEDHHMDSPGIVISKSAENTTTLSKSMNNDEVASKSRNQEEKCSVGDSNEEKTEGLLTSEGGGQLTFSKTSVACDLILASNKDCASRASQEFNKLLPFVDYHIDTSRTTNVSWQKDPHVKGKFVMRKHLLKFKERIMTLRYRAFQHLWKEDLRLLSIRKHHAKSQKRLELSSHTPHTGYPKYWLPARSRLSSPDTQAEPYRSYLKMPLLILDKKEKMSSRFISSNGLVEDPCSLEKERAMINPWTAKEKEIFLDKLANFGKDFKKIASFLHHKTTADCVEFYYKNHKLDCFVKTKKSQLAKQGKSCSRNNYLIASGKRWNHETNTASLAMLGMASAMASNADHGMKKQQKCTVRLKVRATSNHSALRGGNDMLERSSSVDILNSEREAVAADVLAGICSSLSSEAMSSCITSSFDPAESYHDQKSQVVGSLKRQRPFTPEVTQNADDVTCSDESCGEMEHTDWTDEEKAVFIQAVSSYGKDFATISRSVRTRSRNQCKIFFSKARKCLELDMLCPWPCDQRMLGNEDAKEGGSGNNNICTETNSAICSERTGSKVDENMMPSDLNRKCDPAETVILQTDLMSRSEDNGTEAIDEEHELQSEDMVTGWQGEANQKFDFGTNGEENADFPPSVGGGDEATEETNSGGESVPPKCDEDHGEVLPDAEADTFNVGLELKDQHRISDSNLNDRKAEENGILNASSLSDSKCCDKVLHTNRNVSNLAVETNATLGYQVDLKRKQKDALELKAPLEPRTSLLVSVNSVIECPDLSSDGPPALDFENFRDKECQKLAIGNDNNQHQSGHSLLERGGSWPILQGYPFRVFTNKEMNNGDKDFEELDVQSRNRKLRSDMYLSQEWFLQKCNGLKTNSAVAQIPFQLQEQKSYRSRSPSLNSSDTEKPCRKGDVKLFGQILTKSSAQQNEDEGIQNSKFSSKDCNVKFSTHNVEGNPVPAKLNQNNSCLGYGFWDGNRIQSGFSTASDSSFVLHGRPTSLGNYSNSSNMEWQPLPLGSVVKSNEHNLTSILSNREMSSSNGEADYQLHRSWEIARPNPRTVDVTQRQDTLFPEMRRLSGSDAHPGQLAREMVGDACTGISDPAAINLHYAKTEQYSVKAVGIGSEESWRGEEDGMGRSMERAS